MTDYIPQSSASDRYEAARKAVADWHNGEREGMHPWRNGRALAWHLHALITPPGVHESEEQIAARVGQSLAAEYADAFDGFTEGDAARIAAAGVRAGMQRAHEVWEPEVALRPTQEQMLRWLGITARPARIKGDTRIFVPAQYIEREED